MSARQSESLLQDRLTRIQSFNIVDVRTNFWNPFAKHSAVLLDLTVQGFKVEFMEGVIIEPHAPVSLSIPLAPFKIFDGTTLRLKAVIKWFDKASLRAGGAFSDVSLDKNATLERIITFLRENEGLASAS